MRVRVRARVGIEGMEKRHMSVESVPGLRSAQRQVRACVLTASVCCLACFESSLCLATGHKNNLLLRKVM